MSRIINIDRADYHKLFEDIRKKIVEARSTAAYNINTLQVLTNFEIGRLIVEYQQSGKKRAEYGKEIVKDLSKRLKQEFGRGFSEDNLGNMRRFYLTYHKKTAISETLSRISSTGTTKNS